MRITRLHGLNTALISLPFPSSRLPPPSAAAIIVNDSGVIAGGRRRRRTGSVCQVGLIPVDPWAPSIFSQSVTSLLFALSLFPYIGFLYFMTKSNTAPKLTLFGFYFLLVFVGATIPEGIYAKVQYGTSLANIDLLHGGAESLLTLTNLFIVLGLRQALRKANDADKADVVSALREEKETSIETRQPFRKASDAGKTYVVSAVTEENESSIEMDSASR